MKPTPEIKCLLIDPFQCEIYPVHVRKECISDIKELLDCEAIDAVNLDMVVHGIQHVIWVDDEGLLREPFIYPKFVIHGANGDHGMAGYGLITGMDEQGVTTNCMVSIPVLAQVLGFEQWRSRIPIDNVIDKMLRLYKLAI